jgi:membrane fusion protein (multidrug efflux system)
MRAAAASAVAFDRSSVTLATVAPLQHNNTTTAMAPCIALRSITLRTELAGTVRHVTLEPGAIVQPGHRARGARRIGRAC